MQLKSKLIGTKAFYMRVIAIVVPMIKRLSSLVGVVVSLVLSLLLNSFAVAGAIVIAGLLGMLCAVVVARWRGEAP